MREHVSDDSGDAIISGHRAEEESLVMPATRSTLASTLLVLGLVGS